MEIINTFFFLEKLNKNKKNFKKFINLKFKIFKTLFNLNGLIKALNLEITIKLYFDDK